MNNLNNKNINKNITDNKRSLMSYYSNSLEKFAFIFGKIFNKKVEFEIIRLQFPFHDSNILAQILGYNANKYKFNRMIKLLLPKAVIKNPSRELSFDSINNNTEIKLNRFSSYLPSIISVPGLNIDTRTSKYNSYLSGINVRLAGRLMTQSLRPRFTVQSKQDGSLARVKVHFIQKSRFTGKNKRGAFSFTVTTSNVFN